MAGSEFARLLRGLLAEHDLSLRALARQVPVNPGQLSRVLHDLRRPSTELAVRCDAILGTGDLLQRAAERWRPGREASTWLLFAHKLDYLKATTAPFAGTGSHPTRVFCIPEAAVAASPATERLLVLLAAALMEAHGVIVHVTADPAYAEVPGFVWTSCGPALIATWVRADRVWYTDATTHGDVVRDCADAAGDAAADSVIAAPGPRWRLERLAHYLGVDWRWLQRRAGELAGVGWAGLVRPRSRLLSVAGLDVVTRYLAAGDPVVGT